MRMDDPRMPVGEGWTWDAKRRKLAGNMPGGAHGKMAGV
jgi:hypothetical protein